MRVILLACVLFSFSVQGQTVVDSIFSKYESIELSSMNFNDSLFLRIKNPAQPFQYFWLLKNNTHKEINLKELDREIIFAITKSSSAVTYYYLAKNGKKIELNTLKVNHDGSKSISSESIKIDGRFIGSYLDENLHVLTFNKNEKFFLTDTELADGRVVKENRYPLGINLSNHGQISFITEEDHLSPVKASSKLKIYNRQKELVIISDDPCRPDNEDDLTKNFFLTSVIRIDKISGKTIAQTKFEKRKGDFRTFLWRDNLIRMTYEDNNNGVELSSFTLDGFAQKTIQHLPFESLTTVVRDGENQQIHRGQRKVKTWGGKPFILIDTLTNKLVLSVGAIWEIKQNVPALPVFGLAGVLTSFFINGLLLDLNGGPIIQNYSYFAGDLVKDFMPIKNESSSRKKIDDFEIRQNEQAKFYRYKGYARFNGKIYCFYKEENRKSPYLKILSF